MEAATLKRIEELSAMSMAAPNVDYPIIVLPSGMAAQSLEPFMAAPNRFRQAYTTDRPSDFLRYVKNNFEEFSTIYVAPDGQKTVAIFDHGCPIAPQWGDHKATLSLKKTTAYSALEILCTAPRNQQALIDYLEDWAKDGFVECLRHSEEVSASIAIAAIRKVEINASAKSTHEQNDFAISRSSIENLDVKGATEAMPTHIILNSPVFTGTSQRSIYCRISIAGEEGKPQFRLRIMKQEAIFEEIALEIENLMRVSTEAEVFVGSVAG